MGVFLHELGQVNKAVFYFLAAKKIAEKNKDLKSGLVVSENVVDCYNTVNKPKEALKMLDELSKTYSDAPARQVDGITNRWAIFNCVSGVKTV